MLSMYKTLHKSVALPYGSNYVESVWHIVSLNHPYDVCNENLLAWIKINQPVSSFINGIKKMFILYKYGTGTPLFATEYSLKIEIRKIRTTRQP